MRAPSTEELLRPTSKLSHGALSASTCAAVSTESNIMIDENIWSGWTCRTNLERTLVEFGNSLVLRLSETFTPARAPL